jgi:hypothetical protein
MSMPLPNEKHRRRTVNKERTSPTVFVGGPWGETYIEVVKESTSRNVFLLAGVLFAAWAVAAVGLIVVGHRGEAFYLGFSITGAALSIVAAGLAYRSARIATRIERFLTPEVADLERLRAHETESAMGRIQHGTDAGARGIW